MAAAAATRAQWCLSFGSTDLLEAAFWLSSYSRFQPQGSPLRASSMGRLCHTILRREKHLFSHLGFYLSVGLCPLIGLFLFVSIYLPTCFSEPSVCFCLCMSASAFPLLCLSASLSFCVYFTPMHNLERPPSCVSGV